MNSSLHVIKAFSLGRASYAYPLLGECGLLVKFHAHNRTSITAQLVSQLSRALIETG